MSNERHTPAVPRANPLMFGRRIVSTSTTSPPPEPPRLTSHGTAQPRHYVAVAPRDVPLRAAIDRLDVSYASLHVFGGFIQFAAHFARLAFCP
jgi:hypothetical protein